MPASPSPYRTTALSLGVGALGAGFGFWLSFPVFVLTGPAILITLLSLTGMRFDIAPNVRDAALLIIGIGIGASVDSQATAAFLRWPLAFAALAVMLVASMQTSRLLLVRVFRYDPRGAVLAATPGHLTFVMTLGAALNVNVPQIAVVQAVRILSLTLLVPFAALAFGIKLNSLPQSAGQAMTTLHLLALIFAGLAVGLILKRLKAPAAMLIGGLVISALAHVTEITPGPLHPAIALPGFVAIGTLIGTRFSGISLAMLAHNLPAGLATTAVAATFAMLTAIPVAVFLNMPLLHVLIAFAPGGLETMIAMGAVLGANPGFVAATHVARLLMLIVLVPAFLARIKKRVS